MFALRWKYLLEKSYASAWESGRTEPEWPPHPDRVFQALVAAWGNTGENSACKEDLQWLESLPCPELIVPKQEHAVFKGANPTVFVPVNDAFGKDKFHPKKDRQFPCMCVSGECALAWPDVMIDQERLKRMSQLCAAVTHLGMERSFVRMEALDSYGPTEGMERYIPGKGRFFMRCPYPGRLDGLIYDYANGGRNWRRPRVGKWQAYQKVDSTGQEFQQTVFQNEDWIAYRWVDGPRLSLAHAPLLLEAFRKTLIKAADGDEIAMRLVSGHEADGSPLMMPHVAFVPLGNTCNEYADGHLLGVAVVFPRTLSYEELLAVRRAVIQAENPESGELCLTMGKIGTMTLIEEQREFPPRALQLTTWTKPSCDWVTVTPMVCDQMPPRPNHYDEWLVGQVKTACERIGLPCPRTIESGCVGFGTGIPTCREVLPLLRKADGQPRWHVHLRLHFENPVDGPVLLGAGRFRGYGLCKPIIY